MAISSCFRYQGSAGLGPGAVHAADQPGIGAVGRPGARSVVAPRLFWNGLALAVGFGLAALVWSVYWSRDPVFQASLGIHTLSRRFAATAVAWVLGLGAIVAWRLGRIGAWGPLAVATAEALLRAVFSGSDPLGPVSSAAGAEPDSPATACGAQGGAGGRQAHEHSGERGALPGLPRGGIAAPPPNNLLVPALLPPRKVVPNDWRWQRRFGVTHGVWAEDDDVSGTEIMVESPDPAFERLMWNSPTLRAAGDGSLSVILTPSPPLGCQFGLTRYRTRVTFTPLSYSKIGPMMPGLWRRRVCWKQGFHRNLLERVPLASPRYPDPGDIMIGLPARTARVRSWDGRTAIVEHDGACYLTLRRAYYPGWSCRVNGGPEQPVFRINGGLQGVLLALTRPRWEPGPG